MEEKHKIELSRNEALVLFEFLGRFSNDKQLTIVDLAEARVLWDIHAQLERFLVEPFMADYRDQLERARRFVAPLE